jgi:hypothetical protein
VRRILLAALLAANLVIGPLAAADAPDERHAREAADAFGRALVRGQAAALRDVLPAKGKVRLRLSCAGTEEGYYSASQVAALFGEYFGRRDITDVAVSRIDWDQRQYAVVRMRSTATDAEGRQATVGWLLTIEAEGGRWVVREIRETSS